MQAVEDSIAIEEPLEIIIAVVGEERMPLGITMRTPSNDRELVVGFMLTEGIIRHYDEILSIEFVGPETANYGLKNKVVLRLKSDKALDEKKFQRHFLTTSSCGICGKSAIETLGLMHKRETESAFPGIPHRILFKLSDTLKQQQIQFSATGGQHAVGLYDNRGELVCIREDIGRHNAMDKLIGSLLSTGFMDFAISIVCLSGRASFELVQKAIMANIPFVAAVGAPSSLAVELARKHNVTLLGFLKENSFNIYSGQQRVVED